jgi:hypothetical protein
MKLIFTNEIDAYRLWRQQVFMISFLEMLLLVVVSGLFVVTAIVSFAFTKGAVSLTILKNYLAALQPRLRRPATIDPKAEQESLEVLLNHLKTTCDPAVISANKDLRILVGTTYTKIKECSEQQAGDRSSWIQLREVTGDFNEFYFPDAGSRPSRN